MAEKRKKTARRSMTGRAIGLAGLLECQDGAIVSKVLLNKRTGNVTLFAFGGGEGLTEHTSPYDAMIVMVEGSATITIAGGRRRVKAGEMIVMPANKPHAVAADGPFKMLLVMIRS